MRFAAALVPLALLALGACSRDEPEQPVENNVTEEVVEDIAPVNNALPAPVENLTNETPPAAPPPDFSDQEQMIDDADATGLTARLPQGDGEAGSTGNETRPAE